MSITVDANGGDVIIKRLESLKRQYPIATRAALEMEIRELEAESVPLVPVKTGRLRNARTVVVRGMVDPEALLTYNTAYAVYVHERLDVRHKVGEAKFLEKPFKRRTPGMPDRMIRRIQKQVRIR